jgi:thymidylate synthase
MEDNYLNLLREILAKGIRQSNRTGIDTLTLPGAMLRFDLREGFPALTTKKLFFDSVKGELIGFLRGATSAADFRALGCRIWDQNANENKAWLASPYRQGEDDLGRLGYSFGWRHYGATDAWRNEQGPVDYAGVDQIAAALDTLRRDPHSRRILVNAWNPADVNAGMAALPPCHVLFQLLPHVDDKVLHMTMYQRSADMFLGVPFNIASYALLLELFAAWSGYRAGTLTMFFADAHIYENHIDQVHEQLAREPYPLPRLGLSIPGATTRSLDDLLGLLEPEDIWLNDYQSHPAIKAPMAV